jgi:hypothetical protein
VKARTKPLALPAPLTDRYWQITVEDRGLLTFRHPYYGVASAVVQTLIAHREEDRDLSPQATAERMLPMCGLVIGVCWQHPTLELDTVLDLGKLGDADLVAYGHRVCEELQDAGWSLLDLVELLGGIAPELYKRQLLLNMAMARSSFLEAPKGDSTACS